VKPKSSKKVLASDKYVFPGMIPKKQGTLQFIGSFRRGCIALLTFSVAKISTSVGVMVGESEAVGNLTVTVGCIVGLDGAHPDKAKTGIKRRDNQDIDFIIESFPNAICTRGCPTASR
jgi:hypothetical protein